MSTVYEFYEAFGPNWRWEKDLRQDVLTLRHPCGIWLCFDRPSFIRTSPKLLQALVVALDEAVKAGRTGRLQVVCTHHDTATGGVRIELGEMGR